MPRFPKKEIAYTDKYKDDEYEYRMAILTEEKFEKIKPILKKRFLREQEWRAIGVLGGPYWENYDIYLPEPHVLMFRRENALAAKALSETNQQQQQQQQNGKVKQKNL